MSLSHHRRFILITTELIAVIGASLASVGFGETHPARAAGEQPVVAYTVSAPQGITFDSPWVTDATGLNAWALGYDSTGRGVLARRSLATASITTTPTLAGEVGASDAALAPSTGNIAFLATRSDGGGRVVVVDPTTTSRVTAVDTAISPTPARGVGFSPTGSSVYFGANGATPQLLKVSATTGTLVSTLSQANGPVTSGVMWGTRFVTTIGSTTPRLVIVKDSTSISVDSTTTLTGITSALVDPVISGGIGWYGTLGNPGRLVGVDLSLRKVVANFPLEVGETNLRRIVIGSDGTRAFGVTEVSGSSSLVEIRLSDGVRLSTTALGPYTGATSISMSGHYVDVTFPGSVALVRTTTADKPSAPLGLVATEGDNHIHLSWVASSSAEPLVNYVATARSTTQSAECVTTSTSCVIAGLTNGADYTLTVRASSYAGESAVSESIVASPATLPSAVGNVAVNRTGTSATVSWAPGDNGGRPLRDYTVTIQPGGYSCTTPALSCAFINLSEQVAYVAQVAARTSLGMSLPASVEVPVVPVPPVVEPPVLPDPPIPRRLTVPDSPVRVTLEAVNRLSYTLSWTAPADGGSPLIDYRVATRVAGSGTFTTVPDGKSTRTSVVIRRPAKDREVYVALSAVTAVGVSVTPTLVMVKGSRIYTIRSVAAVRLSDAAAFFGSDARSTRYDGTSFWSVRAQSSRL